MASPDESLARRRQRARQLAVGLNLPPPDAKLTLEELERLLAALDREKTRIADTDPQSGEAPASLGHDAAAGDRTLHDLANPEIGKRTHSVNKPLLRLIPTWEDDNASKIDWKIREHQAAFITDFKDLQVQALNKFLGNDPPDKAPSKVLRLILGYLTHSPAPEDFRLLTAAGEKACLACGIDLDNALAHDPIRTMRVIRARGLVRQVASWLDQPIMPNPRAASVMTWQSVADSLPPASFVIERAAGGPAVKRDRSGSDS